MLPERSSSAKKLGHARLVRELKKYGIIVHNEYTQLHSRPLSLNRYFQSQLNHINIVIVLSM